jgi:ABC-type glycerol-3-phosphate transport system substrate-binding protein
MGSDNNAQPQESKPRVSRRRFAQAVGGSALAGVAGCTGNGGNGNGNGGNGNGNGGNGNGNGGNGNGNGGNGGGNGEGDGGDGGEDWPDLSGQSVHVITEMGTPEQQEYWNELAAAFTEATGANVNMEYAGIGTGYRERLTQLLQAGDPPEVTHTGQQDHVTFANSGQAGDLTPAVEFFEDYYDTELTAERGGVIFDDTHYLLPLFINADLYHYREDIIGDRDDSFPETWDDVLTMAEEYDEGQGGMRADYFPLGQNDCIKYYVISAGFSNGANICGRDGDGNVQIVMDNDENRPRWVEVMDYWKERAQYAQLDTQGGCSSMAGAIPAQLTFAGQYFGNRPKIQSVEQEMPFAADVREAHNARQEGMEGEPVLGLLQGVGSFAEADTEAANEYIKFMSQEEWLFDFLMLDPVHNAPIFPEVAEHEEYQTRLENMPDAWSDRDLQAHLSETNRQTFPQETQPPNPYTGALFSADPLWQLGWNVLQEDMDSGEAIDQCASSLRDVLADAQ